MGSGKRKLSRKVKRTIRKALSGVCMASALIVALVPARPTRGYVEPGADSSHAISYSYGVEESDSTDLSYYDSSLSGIVLDRYNNSAHEGYGYNGDETHLVKTYMVSKLSDGSFDYNWQFKVYQQAVNGSPYSIVCKYNDTYAAGTVSIEASIPLSYSIVENDFFNEYVAAHNTAKNSNPSSEYATIKRVDGTTYTAHDIHSKSKFVMPNIDSSREDNNLEDDFWIKKYFPTQYAAYKQKYEDWVSDKAKYDNFVVEMTKYNSDKITYDTNFQNWQNDPTTYQHPGDAPKLPDLPQYSSSNAYPAAAQTNVGSPIYQTVNNPTNYCPSLTCWVADMPQDKDGLYKYFCETHPDYYNVLSGDTYILESVKDSRGGTASGTLTNQYVYMPKGTPNVSFGSSSRNDEYGFRIIGLTSVIGIGAHAFENTSNVTELNLAGEVKYIGDYAFYKSFVNKVVFSNVQDIGNRAFKDCTKLTQIAISDTTVNIGTEAFYGCNMLEAATLSQSISYVGPGAFANCQKLRSLDLSAINQACNISDFAFYNALALSDLKMSDNIARLGDACFACEKGVSGNLFTFNFPDHIAGAVNEKRPDGSVEARDPIGNFVLAGRTNLQHVIMPADYGKNVEVELPYGVFYNCQSLIDVKFPDAGGSCGYVNYGVLKNSANEVVHTMYDTVKTADFCVYGPKSNMSGGVAYPRKSTWGLKSALGNDIPYIYVDTDGSQQVELSNGQYILIIDDNGVLQSCEFATTQQADEAKTNGLDLDIPSTVGDKKVTGIASDCFASPDVHPYIKTIKIADDTISEIAPSSFKDCAMLESVEIGNSVNKIGASAFEGCNKLEYVKFHTPKDGYSSFPLENIGEKAFSTGASRLVFEGDIDENYGPFVWAMDVNNYVDPTNGTRVCYKTGYPYYQTVIVDNRNGYPTLVDYLHYDQIDAYAVEEKIVTDTVHPSVIERYEKQGQEETDASGNISYSYSVNEAERQLVEKAMNLVVPSGIKSVDVNGYINNTSPATEGNEYASNSYNVSAYLNTSPYFLQYKDKDKGGLFRNYYGTVTGTDGKREYPTGDTLELEDIGNDRLRSITFNSVKYLPDYAFYSCENLNNLNLGSELTEMGDAPFTGCKNLTGIGSTTDNFLCENGIVYSKNDDGTYNIVEVLSARGKLVGGTVVMPSESDPTLYNVKEILPGAFENCDSVTGVDFTGNEKITEIPDCCFKDCDILSQVVLPENVKSIGHYAFAGCMEGIEIVCYGKEVYLPKDAFGTPGDTDDYDYVTTKKVTSYSDSAVRKAAADIGADVTKTLDESFKVRFFDYNGHQIGGVVFVKDGGSISMDDVPDDPVREGYDFTGWYPPLKGLKIKEDTFILATYELKPTNSTDPSGNNQGSTSGNNSGNGNGSGNGSSSTSGNNTQFYTLTVTNGNGSGSYAAGATVIITCTNPPSGQVFDKWVPTTDDLGIASVNVAATTLKMPAHEASVTATFKKAPSNSSGSGSSSTSGNNSSNKNNGTTVFITKPGVSNTSLASAQVSGSSDNYVIRISETAQATAAVEKALTNEYGSLDNVRYSAMDISLYDASGVNRITNYSGLSITITMPIPDVMTQYAGNNKVAGVVNEKLDKLKPKFTSIDGVPCVTFTATHFSPYTIYVNTANLSGEPVTIDGSPKTGDGIHPKWFLVAGLVAISIALFFMKDKKPVPKRSIA